MNGLRPGTAGWSPSEEGGRGPRRAGCPSEQPVEVRDRDQAWLHLRHSRRGRARRPRAPPRTAARAGANGLPAACRLVEDPSPWPAQHGAPGDELGARPRRRWIARPAAARRREVIRQLAALVDAARAQGFAHAAPGRRRARTPRRTGASRPRGRTTGLRSNVWVNSSCRASTVDARGAQSAKAARRGGGRRVDRLERRP